MDELLVTMRLMDMTWIHPQQDNSRVCANCGHQLGIYPSGQAALRKNPGLTVVCTLCAFSGAKPDDINLSAGSLAEIRQEARDSVPVKKA
jgi:hypothetical protein